MERQGKHWIRPKAGRLKISMEGLLSKEREEQWLLFRMTMVQWLQHHQHLVNISGA